MFVRAFGSVCESLSMLQNANVCHLPALVNAHSFSDNLWK